MSFKQVGIIYRVPQNAHNTHTYDDQVMSAGKELRDSLNNLMDIYEINVQFFYYKLNVDDGVPYNTLNPEGYEDSVEAEVDYIRDVIENVNERLGGLQHQHIVLIPHGKALWGYGRHATHEVDGNLVHGCLIYAGAFNSAWETFGFTKHEVGHAFGLDHSHGCYNLTNWGFGTGIYNISPMLLSYLYSGSGNVDTNWEGGGNIPDNVCNGGRSNYQYHWQSGLNKEELHSMPYSDISKYEIKEWAKYISGDETMI